MRIPLESPKLLMAIEPSAWIMAPLILFLKTVVDEPTAIKTPELGSSGVVSWLILPVIASYPLDIINPTAGKVGSTIAYRPGWLDVMTKLGLLVVMHAISSARPLLVINSPL